MSGHKRATISISPAEYRRLHEAEMRSRFMNESRSDVSESTRVEVQTHFRSEFDEMQARQQLLIDTLAQMNNEVSSLEQQTCQALIEQQITLADDFEQILSEGQAQTDSVLHSIEQQINAGFDEILERANQNIGLLESELNRQLSSQHQKRSLAKQWIQTAAVLEQFILQNYQHERFQPGGVSQIDIRLILAQNNLAQDLAEAAISSAQEAYFQFSTLRLNLERQHAELNLLLQRVNLAIQKIRQQMQAQQVVDAIDFEGNVLPYKVQVDFWSEGALTTLTQQFEEVVQDLNAHINTVTVEYLNELITHYFPAIEKSIAELVFDARLKVLNSQLRVNIATVVVKALGTQGYALDESYFESDDQRTTYQAILHDYEGNQVVVKIDPTQNQTTENELNIFTPNVKQKTAHELQQRTLEIQRALDATGLQVGIISATPLINPADRIQKHSSSQVSTGPGNDRTTTRRRLTHSLKR